MAFLLTRLMRPRHIHLKEEHTLKDVICQKSPPCLFEFGPKAKSLYFFPSLFQHLLQLGGARPFNLPRSLWSSGSMATEYGIPDTEHPCLTLLHALNGALKQPLILSTLSMSLYIASIMAMKSGLKPKASRVRHKYGCSTLSKAFCWSKESRMALMPVSRDTSRGS